MTWKTLLRKTIAPAVLLSTGLALIVPVSASAEQECSRLQRWVEENQKSISRTYDGIAKYPTPYRRAIFATLGSEEKSVLWQTHLDRYLSGHPDLTARQRSVVENALKLATPAFFSTSEEDVLWKDLVQEPIADLEREARQVFAPREVEKIFSRLGDFSRNAGVETGSPLSKAGAASSADPENPSDVINGIQCSCSVQSDYCGTGYDCWYATCDVVLDACGTFWTYHCNGLCFRP